MPFWRYEKEDIPTGISYEHKQMLVKLYDNENVSAFKYISRFTKKRLYYEIGTLFYIQEKLTINIHEIERILLTTYDDIVLLCFSYNTVNFDERHAVWHRLE